MVEQNRSGAYTQIVYAPTGQKLALMNGQTLQKAFVPLPAQVTAVYGPSGLSYYRHPDWLGSSRFASTPTRTTYSDTAYAPFGEPYAQAGTTDSSFTGQNQDTVGGLHDFLFREYSIQGRWPSADPAGLAVVDLSDPQSLNRFAYVLNNPMNFVDPLGLDCSVPSNSDPLMHCTATGPPPPPSPLELLWQTVCPYLIAGAIGIPRCFTRPIADEVSLGNWRQKLQEEQNGEDKSKSQPPAPQPPKRSGNSSGTGGSTLDDRANALANALNKTGVQSLRNPCTLAAFYGGSAALGFAGGAVAGGEAAGAASAVKEASAPYWPIAFSWLYRQAMTGIPAIRFITKAYNTTTQAVQAGCNALQ